MRCPRHTFKTALPCHELLLHDVCHVVTGQLDSVGPARLMSDNSRVVWHDEEVFRNLPQWVNYLLSKLDPQESTDNEIDALTLEVGILLRFGLYETYFASDKADTKSGDERLRISIAGSRWKTEVDEDSLMQQIKADALIVSNCMIVKVLDMLQLIGDIAVVDSDSDSIGCKHD